MPHFLNNKNGIYYTKNEYYGRKDFLDGTIDDRILVRSLYDDGPTLSINKEELIQMLALLNRE